MLLPEPLLEVVGHGRDRGGAGCRDGGRAGELGPEPGLNLEIGAGQVQKAAPLRHAEVGALHPPSTVGPRGIAARAGERGAGRIGRITAGAAGVVVETNHGGNLEGD